MQTVVGTGWECKKAWLAVASVSADSSRDKRVASTASGYSDAQCFRDLKRTRPTASGLWIDPCVLWLVECDRTLRPLPLLPTCDLHLQLLPRRRRRKTKNKFCPHAHTHTKKRSIFSARSSCCGRRRCSFVAGRLSFVNPPSLLRRDGIPSDAESCSVPLPSQRTCTVSDRPPKARVASASHW